jgi:hypothetical protein
MTTFLPRFSLRLDQMITMNKSAILLVRQDLHLISFNEEEVIKYVDLENWCNYQK